MKFACLCCTYLRPEQLSNAIACFESLHYPLKNRELIVLDDAGQYPDQPSGDRWQVVSVKRRFGTLGQKRNALAGLAETDADAFVVWDDDDAYLPWTLKAHEWALSRGAGWSAPHVVLNENRGEPFFSYHRSKDLFHAAWCIDRAAFEKAGGYPPKNSGEDQAFGGRMVRANILAQDPCVEWPPYFVHRWSTSGSWHLSAYGSAGYERVGQFAQSAYQVEELKPKPSKAWSELVSEFLSVPIDASDQLLCDQWKAVQSQVAADLGLRT